MGLAWVSATALIALIGWRGRFVSRGLALFVALAPAWLFMFIALGSVENGLEILRLRLRGFEFVNRDGPDFRLADAETAVAQDRPAVALDRVSGFINPVNVYVDRVVAQTTTVASARSAFEVRLDYPDELGVFVGLADDDHPFPYNNIYELAHGDAITICPDNERCKTRRVAIEKKRGQWSIGPCALSGWFGGEMRDSTRTLALLDLYHYAPDRCTPRRVTANTDLWVHEVGGDRPTEDDVRSFFIYKSGRLFLAYMDPADLVETSFAAHRRSEAVTRKVSSGDAVAIKLMWKDRRFFKDRVYDDPSVDEALCDYADTPRESDYSGRRLCKRILVYLPETELRVALSDDVRVTLPAAEAPAVSLSCSKPRLDATDSVERCADMPLTAAYAANTRFRPQGVPLLSFPVSLVAGEPVSEVLRVDSSDDCSDLRRPCLIAKGRARERAYPIGVVAALGSSDSERHLVDATYFASPSWLWMLLAAASLQILIIFGLRATRTTRAPVYPAAIVGAALMLLTVRLLFAYKVVALFPHDQESMDLAVSALLIIPALLAALAWPVVERSTSDAPVRLRRDPGGRSSLWPVDAPGFAGLRAAAVGAVVLLAAARLNIVTPPDRWLTSGWLLGLAAIAIAASPMRGWIGGLRTSLAAVPRALPIDRLRLDRVELWLWGLLGALLIFRGLLAVYGRESLGGVRVLLWFLPASFLLTGLVLARLQATPRRALIATVGIAAAAFLAQWTDKGAGVIVCVPIVAVGLLLSARGLRETSTFRVVTGVVLVAAMGFGIMWSWARMTEASLPPVRAGPSQWAMLRQGDGGKNLLCPIDPGTDSGTIDLERYTPLFDLSNTEVRLREFLVPGAATRIGTKVSTRVAESLAIMRRYAAGKETSYWGSGYLSAPVREYGRHELRALLSDGVASVLVASEGGTAGVLGLMALYLILLWMALRHAGLVGDDRDISFAAVWPGLVAVFSLGWMTWFMCAGNIGLLLFSGQNVPYLVVQSGMDVILPTVLFALALSLDDAPETA